LTGHLHASGSVEDNVAEPRIPVPIEGTLLNDSLNQPGTNDFDQMKSGTLVLRSLFGGTLMGLANLVPGISGGTMLLAAGIYPRFIDALADVTRFRFHFRSLLLLGCVVLAAGIGILLLAGTLKELVVDHRWVMYSIFIGLTLGGLPVVWRMASPASGPLIMSAIVAFVAMILLATLQRVGVVGNGGSNPVMLLLAGLAGASAMILPGVSGGYLLLLLGQYVPILSAIDSFKEALKAGDLNSAIEPALTVMLPVGLGVVAGVVIVGNLLQWLLHRYRKATLGALIGLLLGSTVGLWPFQQGVAPEVGDSIKGRIVTEQTLADIDAEDWPTTFYQPDRSQVGGSLLLIGLGFAVTIGIAQLGGKENPAVENPAVEHTA
jgi:putative membrane protein